MTLLSFLLLTYRIIREILDYIKLNSIREAIVPLIFNFNIYFTPVILFVYDSVNNVQENVIIKGITYWLAVESLYRILKKIAILFFLKNISYKETQLRDYLFDVINESIQIILFILIEKNSYDKYTFKHFFAHFTFQILILLIGLTAAYFKQYAVIGGFGLHWRNRFVR